MRILITLLLGLGAVSMAACQSADTAEVKSSQTVMVDVTGMT